MSKKELTEQIKEDWESSLNVDYLSTNPELIQKLYTFFRKYDIGDEELKKQLIDDLTKSLANQMKVSIDKIIIYKNAENISAGSYNKFDKSVSINLYSRGERFSYSAQILTTILHELRHAEQAERLMYLKSDFGRLMKYDTENYTQPSNTNMMQDVGYRTNFTEVDAQTFSFRAGKALAQEVLNNAQDEKRFVKRVLEVKLRDIIGQENSFNSSHKKYSDILENSENIVENLKNHFINTAIAFYNTEFENKKEEQQNANLLADSLEQFIKPGANKTVITASKDDALDIYVTILHSVDPKNIAGKLDNSLTMLFEVMGFDLNYSSKLHMRKDNHLVYYNKYISKIRECVEFGKIFLDKAEIPYNEKDKSEIYEKYSKYAIDYLVDVFKSSSTDEFDKMLAENIVSLEIRDHKRFSRDNLIEKIMKTIPEDEIKNILEQYCNHEENAVVRSFCLDRALLNGYAQKYIVEQNRGSFSRFLRENNISYNPEKFSDIYEKFSNHYPAYFAECISKKELSDFDEELILYAFAFVDNASDEMNKYISAVEQKYSKSKLKKLFEDAQNSTPAAHYLFQKGLSYKDFHKKSTAQKDVEPSI